MKLSYRLIFRVRLVGCAMLLAGCAQAPNDPELEEAIRLMDVDAKGIGAGGRFPMASAHVGSECNSSLSRRSRWVEVVAHESDATVSICRMVREQTGNQTTYRTFYETQTIPAGKPVVLGCFVPEWNEYHLAWSGPANESGRNPFLAEEMLLIRNYGTGGLKSVQNVHAYKPITVKVRLGGGKSYTESLNPGDAYPMRTLEWAKFHREYPTFPHASCAHSIERTPTSPWRY